MGLTAGRYIRLTLKSKVLLWVCRNWPRIDQWAIKHVDHYPEDYDPFKEHRNELIE